MKKLILMFLVSFVSAVVFAGDWFMAQTNSADLYSVGASSELVEAQYDGKYLYPPINVLDGNFDTVWCEAEKNGPGIGQSITIVFSGPVSFDRIEIINGFASKTHPDYYKKNNRVKKIQIAQTAGKRYEQGTYDLYDAPRWQPIVFAHAQTAQTIVLKIVDVYKGDKYDDTCIAGFRLLYKGKEIPYTNVDKIKAVQEENSKLMLKQKSQDFKKQFMGLFNGKNYLYLRNSDSDFIRLYNSMNNLSLRKGPGIMVKMSSKDQLIRDYAANRKTYDYERMINELFDTSEDLSKYDYVLLGENWDDWRRETYSLGNYRINKKEIVDYIEVDSSIIVSIEGNYMYLNGLRYEIIPQNKVMDFREVIYY